MSSSDKTGKNVGEREMPYSCTAKAEAEETTPAVFPSLARGSSSFSSHVSPKTLYLRKQALEIGLNHLGPSDNRDVQYLNVLSVRQSSEGFPYPSFDPISPNGLFRHPFAHRHSKPCSIRGALLPKEDQIPRGIPATLRFQSLKLGAFPQPRCFGECLFPPIPSSAFLLHHGDVQALPKNRVTSWEW